MTRFCSAIMLAVTVALTGCGSSKTSAPETSSGNKGQFGVFYLVSLPRPIGGTIYTADGKINCGATGGANACGPASYLWGEKATLEATADAGYTFYSWAGDCFGSGPCVLDNTFYGADKTVVAVFTNGTSWTLSVAKVGAGLGAITAVIPGQPTSTCAADARNCTFAVPITNPATTVVLTAAADPSSHFSGWSGPCAGLGTCSVEVNRAITAVAAFDAGPTNGGVVGTGGGTISTSYGLTMNVPAGAVPSDTTITVSTSTETPPVDSPLSQVYLFGPAGLVFAQPITVTFPIPPGTTDATVYWTTTDGVTYEEIGGTIVGDTIQVQISHFSRAVVGRRTYLVGGTVSGLTGSGLTVATAGEPNVVIAQGATGFTFSKKLPRGTAYSVAVAQQPSTPAQTCVVTNGSGTVGTAAVSNIAIACATNRYPVGGTISGLAGSGLTLATPGQADLVIPAGASSFVFPTPVPSGTAYAVAITQQPSSPAQTCSIVNGSGTVGGANVAGIAVSCVTIQIHAAGGRGHSALVTTDGILRTWGWNVFGQLGDGSTTNRPEPTQVGVGYSSVVAGMVHTVALKTDGTVWAWGENGQGQLGDGTTSGRVSPVQVGSEFASIATSGSHTVAIKKEGTLWAWGSNSYGEVGDGTTTERHSPVMVGGGFVAVATGQLHTVAVKADGTLWAWGYNHFGQLGDGTITSKTSPVQVGSGYAAVAAGGFHTLALKTDGTLMAWGNGSYGQLGDGTTTYYGNAQVLVGTGYASIAAGQLHSLAVKTDGSLWTWGSNDYGQIGVGTPGTDVLLPTRVGSGFASSAGGEFHSIAVKTDGTIWAWGRNEQSQLGDLTNVERNSPVQAWPVVRKFSVGGTVAGLLGSGLILQNNGGDDLAVVSSGPFAFGTRMPSGSSYSVTVAQQPAGQSCSVETGAGQVGSSDVSAVALTCVANTYRVGGTVSGLTGSGLVLTNSFTGGGVEDVVVNANGPFQFASLGTVGSLYSVAVKTQPGSPPQTCSVAGGSGVLGGPVTDVSVNCVTSTFTIGGSVSGLVGGGLTLATLGQPSLGIPAGASNFVFPNAVWSGTAYAVSVAQQPTNPSQNCVVTNGSGTVGAGNVTGVTVTCLTSQYTVGGTITGLLGSGLTLATPGVANLVVPAGATNFSFASSVTSGAPYSVTVLQNPGSPAQVCSVGSGSGSVESANVSSVVINCRSAWSKIAAGSIVSAGIRPDGTLWTWGGNGYGQIGSGSGTEANSPVQVGTDGNWTSVSAGEGHTVAVKVDGSLWAWGANFYGQMGDGTTNPASSPVHVGAGTTWSSVVAGGYHTVAVKTDGTLWAWGSNDFGQVGYGMGGTVLFPVQIGTDTNWASVAAGEGHTVAIKTDGTLWAWGQNGNSQLGNGTSGGSVMSPVQVGTDTHWASVAAGYYHTVAVKTDGTLWTWGANFYSQLGNGTSGGSVMSPVQVGTDSHWASVAAGHYHTVAVKTDGTLWAWGSNGYGQIGNGTSGGYVMSPVQVGTDTHWASVAAGEGHTLAIKNNGALWAWGHNFNGQIGNGTTSKSVSPVQIGADTIWASVAAGEGHTVAIKTDSTLWAWGSNGYGQLGNGTSGGQVGTDTDWASVAAGYYHTVSVKTDGTLWAWGNNDAGQIGNGTTISSYFPLRVGTDAHWASVAAGYYHTVAVKTDGTLWAWGGNSFGQIGNGTTYSAYTPVQVGTDTNWASVAAGYYHTVAVRTGGTLWGWGGSFFGQIGNGTTGISISPVRVGTDTNWVSVAAGNNHTGAIKADGTLWAWGSNDTGQTGSVGTFIPIPVP